jgi:hypothetical protein
MNLEFREPKNINELEGLLRLRYSVYTEDPLLYKMISASLPHDLTPHDLTALHFGAFDSGKPIGYIRIVTSSETHLSEWVKMIGEKKQIDFNSSTSTIYPFQNYYPDKSWASNFLEKIEKTKKGEVGKLALHFKYRNGGLIFIQFVHALVNYCKQNNFQTCFGLCSLPLERYYKKFGFSRVQGSYPFTYDDLPEAVFVQHSVKS